MPFLLLWGLRAGGSWLSTAHPCQGSAQVWPCWDVSLRLVPCPDVPCCPPVPVGSMFPVLGAHPCSAASTWECLPSLSLTRAKVGAVPQPNLACPSGLSSSLSLHGGAVSLMNTSRGCGAN